MQVLVSLIDTFTYFVESLVVAQLLESVLGTERHPSITAVTALGATRQTIHREQDRHVVRIGWRRACMYLLILLKRISVARSSCGRLDHIAADPAGPRSLSLERRCQLMNGIQ